MDLYIIIYVLLFVTALGDFKKQPNAHLSKNILALWCVFFTLFGGLRWDIGGDFMSTVEVFERSSWSNIFDFDRYGNGMDILEPGYVLLNVCVKTIIDSFPIFDILMCIFLQYTQYKFCLKFSPKRPMLLYIFIMSLGVRYYFPVRSVVALCFVYWAYQFTMNRELKKYVAMVLCAFFVHHMTIVIFPLYWLPKLKYRLKYWHAIVMFVSFATLGYLFRDYFVAFALLTGGSIGEKALHYTEFETVESSGKSILMGLMLNFMFLSLYIYRRAKERLRDDGWYNALLLCFVVYVSIFSVFTEGMSDLVRLIAPLLPAQIILFISTFNYFVDKTHFKLFAILFFTMYYVYRVNSIFQGYFFEDACIPYKTIFDSNIPLF